MMKFALVDNVSRRLSTSDYEVHRGDCSDLEKVEQYDIKMVNAETANDVIDKSRRALARLGYGRETAALFTFKIMPCCEGLRRRSRRDDAD